jgi:hypothetical protein
MRGRWREVLERVLPEYERLSSSGAALSAIVKLGAALAVADEADLRDARDAVRGHVTAATLEAAATDAAGVRGRALHVLSVGTTFTWDELVLVLTIRIELELASLVIDLFGVDTGAFNPSTLDATLRAVALSTENRVRFASALATIRRNWDVPVADRWSGGQ